jgi:uncharacterized protein YjiS (DUF1127 family)
MLVVLEAAGLLVNRVAPEWYLAPNGRPTQATHHRPVRRPSRLWAAVGRGLSRLIAAVRQAYQRRELIRVLSAKDDRLLADIGIARGQIREVADAAVKRGPLHASRLVAPAAQVRHDAAAVEAVANDNAPRLAA